MHDSTRLYSQLVAMQRRLQFNVRLSYDCSLTTVRLQYKYRTATTTTIVGLLYDNRTTTVRLSYDCTTTTLRLLYDLPTAALALGSYWKHLQYEFFLIRISVT